MSDIQNKLPAAPAGDPATKPAWRHRRWVRRSVVAIALLGLLAALHRPLLRGVADFLIVDQPLQRADYWVLLPAALDTQAVLADAARRYSAGDVGGIMVFDPPISRGVRCGAWPDRATALRRELERLGVPARAIVVPPEPCRTTWDAAQAMKRWLQNRPETRLIVVGRLMRGRYDRRIFNAVLDARQAADLQFTAARGGIDENNWWHSREGIQWIFQSYASLAFDWFGGHAEQCREPWTLEEFENSLPAPGNQ